MKPRNARVCCDTELGSLDEHVHDEPWVRPALLRTRKPQNARPCCDTELDSLDEHVHDEPWVRPALLRTRSSPARVRNIRNPT